MKKYLIIIVLAATTMFVSGQNTELIINYLPAVGLGETAEFTESFSPRGMDFEANRYFKKDMSVGFNIGWNVFRGKYPNVTQEIKDNNALITGTQFRYLNTTPLNINVKKYFIREESDLTPYIGIGTGTMYAKRRTDIGVFRVEEDKWLFNVAPEVGFLYDLNRSTSVSFKVKYNYAAKAGDFDAVSYLSFGIGFGLN